MHIHFKVRIYDGSNTTLEFTSQLFFTDAMNTSIFTTYSPYKDRSRTTPDTTDATDGIYGSDGASLLLAPVAGGAGFAADFSVGLSQQTSQIGNDSAGGPGGPPPTATATATATATPSPTTSTDTTTTSGDKTVGATLRSARMVRTVLGTRQLKLTLRASESITARAKLTRGGKTVASRKVTLAVGTRALKVTIPESSKAGAAQLTLTIADAAGNSKRYKRTVHIRSARN